MSTTTDAATILRDALIKARTALGHPDNIAEIDAALVAADRAAIQPAGSAVAWANWKVGTDSYVPYRTRERAEASVRQSEIAATQEGPYRVVPLYAAPTIPQQAKAEQVGQSWQPFCKRCEDLGECRPLGARGCEAPGEHRDRLASNAAPSSVTSAPTEKETLRTEVQLRGHIHMLNDEIETLKEQLADARSPVAAASEVASLRKAFMTLESSGGEGRNIVLKFNQRADAYNVHQFLLNASAPTASTPPAPAQAAQVGAESTATEIVADWPACNPACDYEDPHGGQHDCRNAQCSCAPAKESIARQHAEKGSK